MLSRANKLIHVVCLVSYGDDEKKVQSPLVLLPKQPMPSPTTNVPVSRESTGSKKEEADEAEEEEVSESEEETEESSSDEESMTTPFVEYDAEPLSKTRTQSRSAVCSVAGGGIEQQPVQKSFTKCPSPLEAKSPVATTSERSPSSSVSPSGQVSQPSASSPVINAEPAYVGKSPRSPNYADQLEESKLKSPGLVSESSVLPIGRVSQPSLMVNTESDYVWKSQKSPPVCSSVSSSEADYAGNSQRPPSIHSLSVGTEPGLALRLERSPGGRSNPEPLYAGKSPRSPIPLPQLEYAEFDSEPMSRNQQNIRYVDDADELPPAPMPGSPHKPSSQPVKTPTLSVLPAPPTTPLISSPAGFVQTFEAPSVMVPRATAGPVLMPPDVSGPTARIEASPVLRVNSTPTRADNWRTSEMPAANVRPPSVSRMSPRSPTPPAETGGDAVSELFNKLETSYANRPRPQPPQPTRSHESSYGPGYRPPSHGAVVRQQEPYPVEVCPIPVTNRNVTLTNVIFTRCCHGHGIPIQIVY